MLHKKGQIDFLLEEDIDVDGAAGVHGKVSI
jgi:hypothetical protein